MKVCPVQAMKGAILLASVLATGFAAPVIIGHLPVGAPSSLVFWARFWGAGCVAERLERRGVS